MAIGTDNMETSGYEVLESVIILKLVMIRTATTSAANDFHRVVV